MEVLELMKEQTFQDTYIKGLAGHKPNIYISLRYLFLCPYEYDDDLCTAFNAAQPSGNLQY